RALGLAGTVALRPAGVLAASVLGFVDPRLWAALVARAGHDVTTASLFRSGYELLFTPLPEAEKRATKSITDVSVDKLGTLLGGALVLASAAAAPSQAVRLLYVLSALLCAGALALTARLQRGYVATLEQNLKAGRVRLRESEVIDDATLLTLMRSGGGLD